MLHGIDAGGHGFEKGANIVSLLPEAGDTLAANRFGNIPLVQPPANGPLALQAV